MSQNIARYFNAEDVPQDAVFTVAATIRIQAPARYVFDILTQPATWSRWNTFMPSAEIVPNSDDGILIPGSRLNAAVRMKKGASVRKEELFVTSVEHQSVGGLEVHRVSWRNDGYPKSALRGLRTCEVISIVDGESCEFRSWEWMSGPLAHMVKMMYRSSLQSRFEDMASDLKVYGEDTWTQHGRIEAAVSQKQEFVALTKEVY